MSDSEHATRIEEWPLRPWLLAGLLGLAGLLIHLFTHEREDVPWQMAAAAFVFFGESLRPAAAIGIALGLLALAAMLWRPAPSPAAPATANAARWLYPLLVLAGFGVIDILFKRVAQAGVPLATSLQAMFALALPVAFALALWRRCRGGARFTARNLLGGVLLGLFNFGNILFYLRVHRALPQHPALVFASMNLGVVVLGALAGVLLFRERLGRVNVAGLLLALVAIALLAWA